MISVQGDRNRNIAGSHLPDILIHWYTLNSVGDYLKKTRMKRNQIQSPSYICVVKDTSTITHVGTHTSYTNLISIY